MSVRRKLELARSVVEDHPTAVVLSVLELARSTWYYHRTRAPQSYEEKYAELRQPLEAIARAHPSYGYRRTVTELGERLERVVNHKVVRRLHQCWDLPLQRGTRRPKPSGVRQAIEAAGDRVNLVASLERISPFDVLYTDFTELIYADGRAKAHLMVLLDHAGKLVAGHAVDERAVTELALEAWARAKQTLHKLGQALEGLIVHHDQDPVFTSYAWTAQLLLSDGVRISYALRGARDNPEMESFFGRFKHENRSLILDAQDLSELQAVVARRIRYYNRERRHSTLDNRSPVAFLSLGGREDDSQS
jgi:putative transposase